MWCTALGQLNDCYNMLFPKVNKISVHISIQCNTSMSKNYVSHSYVTVGCVIAGCQWLSMHMKSVAEQGFFTLTLDRTNFHLISTLCSCKSCASLGLQYL